MRLASLALPALLSASASALLVVVACSTGGAPPQGADGSTAEAASTTTVEVPTSPDAPSEAESGEPRSDITNDPPDGGIVMNNATTSGDAGASDRMKGIMDAVVGARDKYRACFDAWAKKNAPQNEIAITLTLKLGPDGKLESAGFKADETDLDDKVVETCMADVSKALAYPASPSEKVTTYNHRFKFKPRK